MLSDRTVIRTRSAVNSTECRRIASEIEIVIMLPPRPVLINDFVKLQQTRDKTWGSMIALTR